MGTGILSPLDRIGWLADQPGWLQEWFAENGRWQVYGPGRVLYVAGEEPEALYGLADGGFTLTLALLGDEPVAFHRAERGFWIGESAILAGTQRLISIATATEVRVFQVPRDAVLSLVKARPEAWESFYLLSHINAGTAIMLLAEVLSLSPRNRLARVCRRLAGGGARVDIRQEELAQILGLTRSSIQRVVAELVEEGILRTGYGHIEIVRPAELERIASGS